MAEIKSNKKNIIISLTILWILWVVLFYGFVFDDIYISCRYADNLRTGVGLVFNAGERVEGYTNFLWTLFCLPFTALSKDPAVFLKALSILSAVTVVYILFRAIKDYWGSPGKAWLMAILLSTSPYFAVWAHPGMETVFFSLTGFLSGYLIYKKKLFLGFFCATISCLVRPEGYIFLASAVFSYAVSQKPLKITEFLKQLSLPLIILAAYNLWRFLYYGSLLPNTYYVKMAGGLTRILPGAEMIFVGLVVGGTGYFLFLSLVNKKRDFLNLYCLIVSWAFFSYSVMGTPDFFTTYRLFTPAIPFILFSASHKINMKNKPQKVFYTILTALNIATIVFIGIFFGQMKNSLERAHGKIARILSQQASAGDVVVSQEMGLIPYRNPGLYFYDVIGLVTEEVSAKLYEAGISPFTMYYLSKTPEGYEKVEKLKAEMRDMIFEKDPNWIITVAYPPWDKGGEIWKDPDSQDSKDCLISYSAKNVFFYNLLYEGRFWDNYELVGVFPSYRIYYLLLFKKKI